MLIKKVMLFRVGTKKEHWKIFSQPLGLLYIISVLRQKFPGQLEIDLIEQALYNLNSEQIRERVKKFNPDLVGLSCLSLEAEEMAKICRIVKEINPNCLTVLGGPHASIFYDYALEKANIDIAVIGEGEETFIELIEKLKKDKPIDDIKGIAFKKGRKILLTPFREPIEDLDNIPFPAWDMIDFKKYSEVISMNIYHCSTPWATIFTSRGCPFQCIYCHNIFGKKTRFRSPENVIAEIELLTQKYGVKEIQIVDDIFNLDINRAKKICDLIIQKGIKIKISFPNGLRGDMMDKELIKKLKKAGCYSITYAIETASSRLQKLIHKNLDLDKVNQAISWTAKEKIITRGFFMLGFPGETKEEMEKTINFSLNSQLLFARFFTVVIYPRTKFMEIAKKIYPNFNFSIKDFDEFHYWAKIPFYTKFTGVDLYKIQKRAMRRFYFRIKIILSILKYYPKNFSLITVIRTFFKK